MIKLADAISNRFPQGNPWASDALAALSGGLEPTTLVHDVAEGWTRTGSGDAAQLVRAGGGHDADGDPDLDDFGVIRLGL